MQEMQEMHESESPSPKRRKSRTPNFGRKASSAAISDMDEEKRQEALSRNRKALILSACCSLKALMKTALRRSYFF